ncbi:hypothetical protein DRO54_02930 [Candidatus Bathyarchaeota archaeon]|nr:MAG: hypothetical protein DRO54_02930 [Candidatus Bathyarchaeota archaeon]
MRQLSPKEVALIICFAALYAATSRIPLFQVIGAAGKSISAGTIMSLVAGLILGSLMGGLATLVGGLVGISINLSQGALGPFSFVPHMAAAMFVGALKDKRQTICVFGYLFALIFFAFFPVMGPFWVYPQMLWFHIISLIVIISPLQVRAINYLSDNDATKLTFGVAISFFTSTLFSHLIGSTVYTVMNMGNLDLSYWLGVWQWVTFIYPIERVMITAAATLIAVPVLKTLRIYGLKV